eukprot:gb/GFBE01007084.1/.p1 GENE.gb/GFBE01007084.1/~~gb/GFBE01007084.1/.p1  ORF type:complete len:192 (+),score=19.85 gb/GFBE01007084.1/:1-576(+)
MSSRRQPVSLSDDWKRWQRPSPHEPVAGEAVVPAMSEGGPAINQDDPEDWHNVREVMIRNIPSRCREDEVVRAVVEMGFAMQLIKFYLPLQRSGDVLFNRGYAFLGFDTPATAANFRDGMQSYCFRRKSSKLVTVHPVRSSAKGESAFGHSLVTEVKDVTWSEFLHQVQLIEARGNNAKRWNRATILRTSI